MTLSHQKTSVILLVPGRSTDVSGNAGLICTNDGAQAYFSPFGFPISGEYYDYGYIDNIIRDDNVIMLEEYFGIPIKDIISNIGRGAPTGMKEKKITFYNTLQMVFIRTEVLNYLETGWDSFNLIDPKDYSDSSQIKKIIDQVSNGPSALEKEYGSIYVRYYTENSPTNMFKTLPIDGRFKDMILKQYKFLMTLGHELNRILFPSNYGGQSINLLATCKLNDFISELMIDDIKEEINDNDPDDYLQEEKSYLSQIGRAKKLNGILNT